MSTGQAAAGSQADAGLGFLLVVDEQDKLGRDVYGLTGNQPLAGYPAELGVLGPPVELEVRVGELGVGEDRAPVRVQAVQPLLGQIPPGAVPQVLVPVEDGERAEQPLDALANRRHVHVEQVQALAAAVHLGTEGGTESGDAEHPRHDIVEVEVLAVADVHAQPGARAEVRGEQAQHTVGRVEFLHLGQGAGLLATHRGFHHRAAVVEHSGGDGGHERPSQSKVQRVTRLSPAVAPVITASGSRWELALPM